MKRISFSAGFAGVLVGSCAGIIHFGCSSPGKVGDGTGAGGTSAGAGGVVISTVAVQGGASGAGGDGGTSGASGGGGAPAEGTCGDLTITPNRAPVDVLLVLDRSDSMGYSMSDDCYCTAAAAAAGQGQACRNPPANCVDRWSTVTTAVSQTISASPALDWGLVLFSAPTPTSCAVSLTPQVPIGVAGGPQIQALLPQMSLQLYTPTAMGVSAAVAYLQTVTDANDKVILLATDGEPNCKDGRATADDDMPATLAAVTAAKNSGYPVYVVGIGPQQAITNLDSLAVAGGTDHYYPAASPQDLADSLSKISKIVATTCAFQTPKVPEDPTLVYVYVNKALISKDAQPTDDGWTFGPTTSDIVLTGSYCTDLLAGANWPVQIIFGCSGYIPQQNIP